MWFLAHYVLITIKSHFQIIIDAFEFWCWRRLLNVPWTARKSNQSFLKEISLSVYWKDWCWSWNSNNLATWWEELTHWKRPWGWERLKAKVKGEDRGWDYCIATQTWWTWVWASSGSWWWTGKPGVLQSMGSQRVRHYLATELTDWLTERQVWNVFAVNHLKKKEIELYPVWRKIEQKEGWLAHSMEKRSSKR